jgi:hypothetical protein
MRSPVGAGSSARAEGLATTTNNTANADRIMVFLRRRFRRVNDRISLPLPSRLSNPRETAEIDRRQIV